ncbi:MAG: T9SS type A sorting domain-containing protein [Flavobacteriales bacterium]|nr:T9SS type A sorting domain-containing protein [Flavobacteriales bacterium]
MELLVCARSLPALLLWCLHALAFGQTGVQWGAVQDCNAPGDGGLRPRIAVNGQGLPVVLWGKSNPASNLAAVGNGSGFSSAVEVSLPGLVPAVADWMGSSLAAQGDTVWVVMKATPEESRPTYLRRSTDGGQTWGDTLRVDPLDGLVSRFPSIAITGSGEPVVQYMQFDSGYYGARQVVCRMVGGAFMPPVQVSTPFAQGDVCDCCPNQVVCDGQRVAALYRNAGSNIRVLWAATSPDGGATFPTGALVDSTGWVFPACPSSGPGGLIDGDSLRYVWMSGANNGNKVYLGSASMADLGNDRTGLVHPGQPANLQQNFPRIAGQGDTLGIVWQQTLSGQAEILFSWSVAGPAGLSQPDTVNVDLSGSQRTPDIAYANGTFHIIWSEGTSQVRYRQAIITEGVGIQELAGPRLHHWPDPATHVLHLAGAWSAVQVFDLQGRIVMDLAAPRERLDVQRLPAGTYLLRAFAKDGSMATATFRKG